MTGVYHFGFAGFFMHAGQSENPIPFPTSSPAWPSEGS
jgi:hypothetical protein